MQRTVDDAASALARERVEVPIATTSEGGVDRGIDVIDLPSPRYPTLSVRRGEEGLVLLRVVVGPDGRVLDVEVLQAPGFGVLRAAAAAAVRLAPSRPAVAAGRLLQHTAARDTVSGGVPRDCVIGARSFTRSSRTGPWKPCWLLSNVVPMFTTSVLISANFGLKTRLRP